MDGATPNCRYTPESRPSVAPRSSTASRASGLKANANRVERFGFRSSVRRAGRLLRMGGRGPAPCRQRGAADGKRRQHSADQQEAG
jgi:hypothetical protein